MRTAPFGGRRLGRASASAARTRPLRPVAPPALRTPNGAGDGESRKGPRNAPFIRTHCPWPMSATAKASPARFDGTIACAASDSRESWKTGPSAATLRPGAPGQVPDPTHRSYTHGSRPALHISGCAGGAGPCRCQCRPPEFEARSGAPPAAAPFPRLSCSWSDQLSELRLG